MISRSSLAVAALGVGIALAGGALLRAQKPQQPEPQQQERPVRLPPPSPEEIAKLPPDGGAEFNRLVHEQSPYLLQHARNPVDWYPWGSEAFEVARAQDKPVFLSIGYSTCHWCHVMEHESFEDAEVAQLLNDGFVCVKVDREERPDIDQVYMAVTQSLTGQGGWPMTVVMTADKQPFFAGTYFPKRGRHGRRGMMELLPMLSQAWKGDRERVLEIAQNITRNVGELTGGSPGQALNAATLDLAFRQLRGRFDAERGGFGQRMKFPIPHNLRFLLRYHLRTGDASALEMVEKTLEEMRAGGIWDHLGHGFHRYSTDPEWLVPHFEKMLYDQALLALAYTEAWQLTGAASHRDTAERILTYVMRDMTAPGGGFYSAEDADSEGEEGLFYLWTVAELEAVLGEQDADLAAFVWNVADQGNFRDEATGRPAGRNILHTTKTPEQLAALRGLEVAELETRLEDIRARLFEAREARIHPFKDDKILTDWNGLMIAAFAKAARAFDQPRYARAARRAADFLLSTLRDGEGRLLKRARGGSADLTGLIDDYAFAVHGLLELYTTTQEVRYLSAAIELAEHMIAHFWDDEGGGFYLAPDDGEQLIVRAKESYDGAIPAGNSVAILDLLWLARITAQPRYDELAARAIEAFGGRTSADPSNYTQLMAAVDFIAGPSFEIVVAGGAEAEDTRAMLRALHHRFRPNKVVLLRPEGDEPAIAGIAPYTADQTAVDGKATAYVCRDFACRAPTTEIEVMLAALELPASTDAGNAPKEDGPKKDGADGDGGGGDDGR